VGALLSFGLTPAFSLDLGALYTQKGFNIGLDDINAPAGSSAGLQLTYIEIPFLARGKIATGGSFTPYVFGGPAVRIETNCRVTAESQGASASLDCDNAGTGVQTEAFDVGAMIGAGVELELGPVGVTADISYDVGLKNLNDNSQGSDSIKNRTLTFSAGLVVPLGAGGGEA
jgi:hypothetical protein